MERRSLNSQLPDWRRSHPPRHRFFWSSHPTKVITEVIYESQ